MKYDFNQVCDRKKTNCYKWDMLKSVFGHDNLIPMWVADMDFPVAKPIVDALKKRAEHPFYGYTEPGDGVIDSVVHRMQQKFKWEIDPEWVVFTPGVVPALHIAIRSITHPGDGVIMQKPVYYPFFPAVTNNGCQIVNNPLKLINGHYEMDFEDLEHKFSSKEGMFSTPGRLKAALLCNPHNPVGRLWRKEELIRFGEIVIDNNAVVISDEIHCEIRFNGHQHTPFATVSKEFEQNCIVCMSPSKTFNLAGLEASSIIIPNKKLREDFISTQSGMVPGPNLFGYAGLEAAYRYGDEWLEQVLDYLQGNLDFLLDYFARKIPDIKVIQPQGTYLIWLDCRDLCLDDMALRHFMRNNAKIGLNDGFVFGEEGRGFMRMNIACPRPLLEEALRRIEAAVNNLKS